MRMGPGFAINSGISSAITALKGITDANNPIEGKWGLYTLYHHGKYDSHRLTARLEKTFEGVNVFINPYLCGRGNHVFIDATMELLSIHNIKQEDISKVKIYSDTAMHQRSNNESAKKIIYSVLNINMSSRLRGDIDMVYLSRF